MVAEYPHQKMTRFVLRFRKIRESILKTKKKNNEPNKKKRGKTKKNWDKNNSGALAREARLRSTMGK